ncbi:DoxX family protein [Streptomyces sp. PTD9-10]|uniref:DoxX family protein n=1 Tax=Streptomyces sp. PTD9-10 TaxID=3120151 RepID=UPI0030080A52
MDHCGAAGRGLPGRRRHAAEPVQAAAGHLGWAWVEDFGDGTVKVIGALKVLAAAGLILPAVLHVAPVLVPLAAVGWVLLMTGAVITHLRRQEAQAVAVNLVLLALAAFVAWGRFGPHSFTG